jgi:hypothetical protein
MCSLCFLEVISMKRIANCIQSSYNLYTLHQIKYQTVILMNKNRSVSTNEGLDFCKGLLNWIHVG